MFSLVWTFLVQERTFLLYKYKNAMHSSRLNWFDENAVFLQNVLWMRGAQVWTGISINFICTSIVWTRASSVAFSVIKSFSLEFCLLLVNRSSLKCLNFIEAVHFSESATLNLEFLRENCVLKLTKTQ